MKIKRVLNEDTLGQSVDRQMEADAQKAANQMDQTNTVNIDKSEEGDIEEALDRALKTNKRQLAHGGKEFVNVLLVGRGGTGKTARVKKWAASRGLNLVEKDAKSLDVTDMGGAISPDESRTKVNRLATSEWDDLDAPNSVLFLDEYNRAASDVRGSLLTLINDHQIPAEHGKYKTLKGFLFTIAAINPPNPNYNTDTLDAAERSRFYQVQVNPDPIKHKNYLIHSYERELQQTDDAEEKQEIFGRMNIAKTLLSSPIFKFDDEEDEDKANEFGLPILNNRTLSKLLEFSDGTKDNFLKLWDGVCNPNKKGMATRILAAYKDPVYKDNNSAQATTPSRFEKTDKANDALNRFKDNKRVGITPQATVPDEEDDAPAFQKPSSNGLWDKISSKL